MIAEVDSIGSWSAHKLDLLNDYLTAYTNIMNTQRSWCEGFYYIDAFAGSVKPYNKEHKEFIDGSPRIALCAKPPFDGYDFIEIKDGRVIENIAPLMDEFSGTPIQIHHGDCNEVLLEKILPRFPSKPYKTRKRGFIFLDPYGLELDWKTVEAIGNAGVFDVFINFSVMGVTRQCSKQPPTGKMKAHIDRVMGDEGWLDKVYAKNDWCGLPGLEDTCHDKRRLENVTDKLIEYYRERLGTCFECVSNYKLMRNSSKGPMYALILASQKDLAIKKMHEIFKRHEKQGR